MTVQVDLIECERGWGQKTFDSVIFATPDEAGKYVKEYNDEHMSVSQEVPDYYTLARIVDYHSDKPVTSIKVMPKQNETAAANAIFPMVNQKENLASVVKCLKKETSDRIAENAKYMRGLSTQVEQLLVEEAVSHKEKTQMEADIEKLHRQAEGLLKKVADLVKEKKQLEYDVENPKWQSIENVQFKNNGTKFLFFSPTFGVEINTIGDRAPDTTHFAPEPNGPKIKAPRISSIMNKAWEITKSVSPDYHSPKCAYVKSNGACICDCNILMKHPDYVKGTMQ